MTISVQREITDPFKLTCASLMTLTIKSNIVSDAQGPEEMCLSLEHQNPSKTSEKMVYFDRVTVSLHIL